MIYNLLSILRAEDIALVEMIVRPSPLEKLKSHI